MRRRFYATAFRFGLALGSVALLVGACEYTPSEFPEFEEGAHTDYANRKTIFGEGGLDFFGDDKDRAVNDGAALGVNSFLWRASLDTISFMPVNSADPFGGVIITDWHSTVEAPDERFKLNVYILGRTLRADGVRVAVFRQTKNGATVWQDATVPAQTGPKIEEAILTRARQLRHETLQNR